MKHLLTALVLVLAGCHAPTSSPTAVPDDKSFAKEIRDLKEADAVADVEARIRGGNAKFLACYTDQPEGTYIPGLSAEEMREYIDSGQFQSEVFFDHRTIYVFQFSGDTRPWEEAKWDYAARINRALVSRIRRERQTNQQPLPPPGKRPPSNHSQLPGAADL